MANANELTMRASDRAQAGHSTLCLSARAVYAAYREHGHGRMRASLGAFVVWSQILGDLCRIYVQMPWYWVRYKLRRSDTR